MTAAGLGPHPAVSRACERGGVVAPGVARPQEHRRAWPARGKTLTEGGHPSGPWLHLRSSNELPPNRMDDGFEPGVRSELLVDVMQVIAQRLR